MRLCGRPVCSSVCRSQTEYTEGPVAQAQRVAQQQAAAAAAAAAAAVAAAAAEEERAFANLLPRPVLPALCQLASTRAPPVLLSVQATVSPPQVTYGSRLAPSLMPRLQPGTLFGVQSSLHTRITDKRIIR